jgi:hypothetical protein
VNKRYFLLILIIACFHANLVSAAAWTKAEGSGQFIGTLSGYFSNHYFDREGNSRSSDVFLQKFEVNPFLEYGITDDITVGFNQSIQNWNLKKKNVALSVFDFRQCGLYSNGNIQNVSEYVSEIDLFLRKKLWDKDNLVLSVQPLIKRHV